MKINFYGSLGEKIGAEIDLTLPAEADTVEKLRNVIADLYPDAARDLRERSRACIADLIVGEGHKLSGTETVEFFPPLSGG